MKEIHSKEECIWLCMIEGSILCKSIEFSKNNGSKSICKLSTENEFTKEKINKENSEYCTVGKMSIT